MIELRRAADRGVAERGWLSSRHTFSFGNYHDPGQVGFSDLLVINKTDLAPHVGVELKSAQLGVRGVVDWAQEPARLDFDGDAQLGDLALRDPAQNRELLAWRELRVAGIAYAQQRNRLDIARVDLVAPRARVEISPERELNLSRAFAPPGAKQDAAPAAAPPGCSRSRTPSCSTIGRSASPSGSRPSRRPPPASGRRPPCLEHASAFRHRSTIASASSRRTRAFRPAISPQRASPNISRWISMKMIR